MTINLPENLERSILAEVHSGHFASLDEAVAEAVRLLLRQRQPGEIGPPASEAVMTTGKPIWEVADELRQSIPAEEWATLPVDGAAHHDHYIYGTPKRPAR